MFNLKQISKKLNEENYFITQQVLTNFIKAWRVEAIWENEEGEEFYDDFSIAKIKKGISLKSQGYNNDQIIHKLSKFTGEEEKEEVAVQSAEIVPADGNQLQDNGLRQNSSHNKLTVDITSQTLQMIAEAVAGKITADIKAQFESADFTEKLIEAGYFKKDNELLATQVKKLIDDNRNLTQKVDELEKKKSFWQRLM